MVPNRFSNRSSKRAHLAIFAFRVIFSNHLRQTVGVRIRERTHHGPFTPAKTDVFAPMQRAKMAITVRENP